MPVGNIIYAVMLLPAASTPHTFIFSGKPNKMRKYLKIVLLLVISTFLSCTEERPQTKNKSILVGDLETKENPTYKDCYLVEVRDKTIKNKKNNVTGLEFYCNDSILISSLNLAKNSPYKDIEFPTITETTKYYNEEKDYTHYYHIGKDFEDRRKRGTIYYNLEDENFENINNKIPHKLPNFLKNYDMARAYTGGLMQVISSEQAILFYTISIYGSRKQNKEGGVIFLGSRLSILDEFGNKDFEIIGNNYGIGYSKISPIGDFLTFTKTEMVDYSKKINGFEIHNLRNDSLLYDYNFDTTTLVEEPLYIDDDLILFRIAESSTRYLKELFLFDLVTSEVQNRKLAQNYDFNYFDFVDEQLIFVKSEGYNEYTNPDPRIFYDTIQINDFVKSQR